MAKDSFDLIDGLKVGDVVHKRVTLRSPTGNDLITAIEAAERPVRVGDLIKLIASDEMMSFHLLARQIEMIGNYPMPLQDLSELRLMSGRDLALLQARASALDAASNAEMITALGSRGRSEGAGS